MRFLKNTDEGLRKALLRIRQDSDGERILVWLRSSLEDADRANRAAIDGVLLRQGQGGALALQELIDALEGKQLASARPESKTAAG